MAEHDTARIEAFSDGVFAIAITLLILTIQPPVAAEFTSNRALLESLARLWPSFLAFLLSFIVILMIWANHHDFFRMLRAADRSLLFANGGLLLMVTFLPFPTAVLAGHLHGAASNAAVGFYCSTLFVTSIAHNVLLEVAAHSHKLIRPDVSGAEIAQVRKAYRLGLLAYATATLVSVWSVGAALVITTSLWVLWTPMRHGFAKRSTR